MGFELAEQFGWATGIRVPIALGDFLILSAVRESRGFAMAVSDEAILASQRSVASREGLLLCPEGAATHAAYLEALRTGRISSVDRVVLPNFTTGLKYPITEAVQTFSARDPDPYRRFKRRGVGVARRWDASPNPTTSPWYDDDGPVVCPLWYHVVRNVHRLVCASPTGTIAQINTRLMRSSRQSRRPDRVALLADRTRSQCVLVGATVEMRLARQTARTRLAGNGYFAFAYKTPRVISLSLESWPESMSAAFDEIDSAEPATRTAARLRDRTRLLVGD